MRNIALELLKNERLYIKVCHIMNLMSLEPPFEEDYLRPDNFLRSDSLQKVTPYMTEMVGLPGRDET